MQKKYYVLGNEKKRQQKKKKYSNGGSDTRAFRGKRRLSSYEKSSGYDNLGKA